MVDKNRAEEIIEYYVNKAPPISLEKIQTQMEGRIVANHLIGDTLEAARIAELVVLIRSLRV